jgi:predicted nucleic acid-binding protein
MSYLLDHPICSGWLRGHKRILPRIALHAGQLHVSALSLMMVERWLLLASTPSRFMQGFNAFVRDISVVNVNDPIAHRAAMLELQLRRQKRLSVVPLIVAATALERGLTLVTHDADFQLVPGLTLVDWSIP